MAAESLRIAMLIDGDNAQASLIEHILAETAKYGTVTTRRIYGDWTTPNMGGWKDSLHTYAVQPAQQFRYTTGKNATDSALIIEAMDLLHAGTVGGFCIVSSDSDYTRLAMRIREQGLFVMGIGRFNTPKSFVNACEVFAYTENLSPQSDKDPQHSEADNLEWLMMVKRAIEKAEMDDGWALLAAVGNHIHKMNPDFDPRTYKHKQLSSLSKSEPSVFETWGTAASLMVRLKS